MNIKFQILFPYIVHNYLYYNIRISSSKIILFFPGLLYYMRQLMCHQPSPLTCPWCILSSPEHNILSQCISLLIQCLCRFSRLRITMQPHLPKIDPKPQLKIGTLGFRQRLAAAFKGQDMRFKIGINFKDTT